MEEYNLLFEEAYGHTYCRANGEFHMYQDGYWRRFTEPETDWIDVLLKEAADKAGAEYARDRAQLLTTINTYGHARAPEHGFDTYPDDRGPYLVCNNGTLDLREDKENMLGEHNPEHHTTCYVDTDYNPKARCDHWLASLRRSLEKHQDPEGVISFLQEWFGVNLVGAAYKQNHGRDLRHALILLGPARTAKSTVASAFIELLGGAHRVATMSMDRLGSQFGASELVDTAALVSNDGIGKGTRMNTGVFKNIVTGEPLTVEKKFKQPERLAYHGGVMFTTNALPEVEDEGDAVYKRIVVLRFERVFTDTDSMKDFDGKNPATYWRETGEFAGILNWALEGFDRVHRTKQFTMPAGVKDVREEFRMANDPVFAMMREFVVPKKKQFLSIKATAAMLHYYASEAFGRGFQYRRAVNELLQFVRSEMPQAEEVREDGEYGPTFWSNLTLNEEGKKLWGITQTAGVMKSHLSTVKSATARKI